VDPKHESIENFIEHIEVLEIDQSKGLKSQLTSLQNTLSKLESSNIDTEFFPFENASLGVEQIESDLKHKAKQIEMHLEGYTKLLNYVPLSWQKNGTGFPAFIILPLDSSDFTIKIEAYDNFSDPDYEFLPTLPQEFTDLFENAISALANESASQDYEQITVAAQYSGIVPRDSRKLITKAIDSSLFDDIYLIAEAPTWAVDETRITSGKAIVAGWVQETAQLFIITIFDPIPLETYLEDLKRPSQK
jgi:hypothetical protein